MPKKPQTKQASLNLDGKKTFRFKQNKYNAKKTVVDGINFPSMAEAGYYILNKARPDVVHIDTHVPVTLIVGEGDKKEVIRWKVDQIVWVQDHESIRPRPEAHEVKGIETPDFKLKHQLFNALHPLAPLKVFKKNGKNYKQIY